MKLIIAGGRNIPSNIAEEKILQFFSALPFNVTGIISGGARGVDTSAERMAKYFLLPFEEFPANWDKFGKSAGYRRNALMAENGDALLLIWDGKSRGSAMMKNLMKLAHKPVYEAIVVF